MASPRKFTGEEHITECLVIISINCPSKTNETTLLPSNEQTGSGGDELAVQKIFLNQAHTSHRPAHTWFIRIASVRERLHACLCVCVFVSTPKAINN